MSLMSPKTTPKPQPTPQRSDSGSSPLPDAEACGVFAQAASAGVGGRFPGRPLKRRPQLGATLVLRGQWPQRRFSQVNYTITVHSQIRGPRAMHLT